jgi:hypothetical protein
VDWGIGWYSDHSPLKHNTSIHPVMGFEQLESLTTPIPSSRGLEIVGTLNHLTLWGR